MYEIPAKAGYFQETTSDQASLVVSIFNDIVQVEQKTSEYFYTLLCKKSFNIVEFFETFVYNREEQGINCRKVHQIY